MFPAIVLSHLFNNELARVCATLTSNDELTVQLWDVPWICRLLTDTWLTVIWFSVFCELVAALHAYKLTVVVYILYCMVHLAFVCALKIIRLIFLLSAGDKVEVVYCAYRQPQFFTMEVLAAMRTTQVQSVIGLRQERHSGLKAV